VPDDDKEGFQLRPESGSAVLGNGVQPPRKPQLLLGWQKQVIAPVKYLIDGLLIDLPGGIHLLSGPTSVGKTKVAARIAFSIGTGHELAAAHPVSRTGGVIWFAPEGERQVIPYMRCIEQNVGGYQPIESEKHRATPIVVVPSAEIPKLEDRNAQQIMRLLMEQASEEIYRRFRVEPALFVTDTYSRVTGAIDPDKSHLAEMIFDKLMAIGREFKSTPFVLDHTGKDPNRGTRGSSAKPAAAEIELMIKGETGQTSGLLLEMTKNRHGPLTLPIHFNLCAHSYIGDDGARASDVIPAFRGAALGSAARPSRNRRWQPARQAFFECLDGGKFREVQPPKANHARVKAVSLDDWKDEYRRVVPADKKDKTIDRAFQRAVEDLLGVVGSGERKHRDSSRQMVEFDEIAGEKMFWWVATEGDSLRQFEALSPEDN
jgi:hypothetical protein